MIKINYKAYFRNPDFNIDSEFISKIKKPIFEDTKENLFNKFQTFKKQNHLFRNIFWKI